MFRLQEGELLLNGQDKVDRLKQYYDQITVLRGAALNGFILFGVCAFGWFGNLRVRWLGRHKLEAFTFLPAGGTALAGLFFLLHHWHNRSFYSEPPLAELVLILLGGVALFLIFKAKHAAYYGPTCVVALVLAVISFGGWWWTEVLYDLHVIHSVPELNGPDSSSPTYV